MVVVRKTHPMGAAEKNSRTGIHPWKLISPIEAGKLFPPVSGERFSMIERKAVIAKTLPLPSQRYFTP